MVRFVIWMVLAVALIHAATLVRDGQTTLLGTPSPWLQQVLARLPLPVAPPAVVELPAPPVSDPALLRRLTLLEAAQREQAAALVPMADLLQSVALLQKQMAYLESNRRTMEAGEVKVRWDDSGWRMEDFFAKRRVWSQRVDFPHTFNHAPRVALGMIRLETGPEGSIEVQAQQVEPGGFTLALQAEEGRPREVKVQWLAFGEQNLFE